MDTTTPRPTVSYAGFWKRFLAHLIDKVLLSILSLIVILPFIAMIGLSSLSFDRYDEPPIQLILALLSAYFIVIFFLLIAEWLYYALMESTKGATLGKMALGIKVTDLNGDKISFARATGRHFGKIISGLTLCVGYIIAGFSQQKQALHDIIAGCLVVNK